MMGSIRPILLIVALHSGAGTAFPVRAAVILTFNQDAYTVAPGGTLSLAVHLDADDSTAIFDPPPSGLRRYGIQLLARHISAAIPPPDLDYEGMNAGAMVTIFPDSAQIRGEAAPSLVDGYRGTLIGSFTLAIPGNAVGTFSIATDVIRPFETDSGIILSRPGLAENDYAQVTIIPEPTAVQFFFIATLAFTRRRSKKARELV